jgi:hypothetical protein
MSSSSVSDTMLSLVMAPVISTDSGSPPPSPVACSSDPGLARSTGFAPRWFPRLRAGCKVHADSRPVQPAALPELIQQQLFQPLEHPASAHSANRRQQVVALPQRIG